MSTTNPYQSPQTTEPAAQAADAPELIRQAHIKHEASVRSVGILYWFGGAFLLVSAFFGMIEDSGDPLALRVGLLAFLLTAGILQLATGFGLRRLRNWARIPTALFSAVGLIAVPLGTIINGYILYLILSRKGAMVFSAEYQEVIAATPHIRYRMSKIIWVLLGLLLVVVLAILLIGVGVALFRG